MKYFEEKINLNLKKIFLHRVITSLALQFAGSFSIIFLYQFFANSHFYVILFYLFLAIFSFLLIPFIGKVLNKIGYKKSLIIGASFRMFLWLSYFLISYFNWFYGIIFVFISLIFLRFFYWVPFHTEVLLLRNKSDHSKSISFLASIGNFVGIIGPLVSGVILSYFNYSYLYGIGVILLLFAVFPLKKIDRIKSLFEWSYGESMKRAFSKKNKEFFLPTVFNGVESILGFLWPIFIFNILDGDFLKIGFVLTVTNILVIIINLFIAKKVDKNKNEKDFIKYGTALHSLGWILKIFAFTPFFVFAMDLYHKISRALYKGAYDSLIGAYVVDRGHLVDEFTVIKEIGFRFGQIISSLIVLLLSFYLELNELFFIAAFAVLMLNKVPEKIPEILKKDNE